MTTSSNSYFFCEIESGKLHDNDDFQITVLFVQTKEMSVKKFAI